MASVNSRLGRVPCPSIMLSYLRLTEEAADYSALEYYESLGKERRLTQHMPQELANVDLEEDNGNTTFRNSESTLPLAMLPIFDSNDENLMELLA